jgi:hypothetical protein
MCCTVHQAHCRVHFIRLQSYDCCWLRTFHRSLYWVVVNSLSCRPYTRLSVWYESVACNSRPSNLRHVRNQPLLLLSAAVCTHASGYIVEDFPEVHILTSRRV